jgi:transcriptional regulator with XRE-family HTH domain
MRGIGALARIEPRPMRLPFVSTQQAVLLRMLAQLREDAGLNQTALADRLGITQSEVSKFERGERALDVLRLRAWLHALGIEFAPFAYALDQQLGRLGPFID